jgi:hypothetical protein
VGLSSRSIIHSHQPIFLGKLDKGEHMANHPWVWKLKKSRAGGRRDLAVTRVTEDGSHFTLGQRRSTPLEGKARRSWPMCPFKDPQRISL